MTADTSTSITRAEVCVLACAEAWRGDGEIVASPMGTIPTIGARLARASFEPELLLSDGEAYFGAGTWALGTQPSVIEGIFPYRAVFDLLWSGRRHVMMGASQIDAYGNTNISAIGTFERPKAQLLGARGAPGNTVNHATSYWIPRHTARTFVDAVDFVSGLGYNRPGIGRFHHLPRVVSNLGVFDFATADHRMQLVSLHPGVELQTVLDNTGFELGVPHTIAVTPSPDGEQLRLIREVIDPGNARSREVPA